VVVEDDKLAIGEANMLPEGVIKLSIGKKRHALIRPV
jgi:tyrosyl-tRNA synthetase